MDKYNNAFRILENFSKSKNYSGGAGVYNMRAAVYITEQLYIDVSVGLELNQQRDTDRKKKEKEKHL